MQTHRGLFFLIFLFLPYIVHAETLLSNLDESTTATTSWLVRSNVRYAHQFTAGGAATISTVKTQLSGSQKYPSNVSIRIHSDSSNSVDSLLGTLTYDSIDGNNLATYTGSVDIPSAGTYWIEIYPTAAIANHYYASTSSTNSTGAEDWDIKKGYVANGSNSISWSTFVGTPYTYPKIAFEGTNNATQTVTTLAASVDLTASPWLTDSNTTLDLSGATISDQGQSALEELTGLDGSLDSIDKTLITTLKLDGNTSLTEIPANIFSTFTNLETLELQDNTGITTINANAFNEISLTDLRLDGNTSLTTLAANTFNGLSVSGTLYLNDSTGLTTLNSNAFNGLTLTGNLRLDGNTGLTSVPSDAFNGLTVGGNLLFNNTGITTIADNAFSGLTVSGNLQINSNSSLTSIAANAFNGATITGDIQIHSNTSLTSLSETAFNGATIGGTVSFTGNTNLTVPESIINTFFGASSITGDVRLDNTALSSLTSQAFKSSTVSNDLRIDNNATLTTLPTEALQSANVGNDLRIDSTGITTLQDETFKGTVVGNNLSLASNASLTSIQPKAFYNVNVTGNIDLENTTALTTIPWCAFDAATVTGVIKFANSGIVNALPDGPDKTTLINGATKEEIKIILERNPSIASPVKQKEYAEIVKIQNKRLGPTSANGG